MNWVITITVNPGYFSGREGSEGVRAHIHTIFVKPQVTGVTANSTATSPIHEITGIVTKITFLWELKSKMTIK